MNPKCPECNRSLAGWIDIGPDQDVVYRAACLRDDCPARPHAESAVSVDAAMRIITEGVKKP